MVVSFEFFYSLINFCFFFRLPRMKRANSLNVLNVGARENQDGTQVSKNLSVKIRRSSVGETLESLRATGF